MVPASGPPAEEQHPAPSGHRPPLDPGPLDPGPLEPARPDPGQGPSERRGARRPLILMLSTLAALGAAGLAVILLVGGAEPEPSPAAPSVVATVTPQAAGELPVPGASTGTATLSDPAITAAKAPLAAAVQWCSLLSADDVRVTTGFEQRGRPDGTSLCTHYLADGAGYHDAGYFFVSEIPALQGAAHTVRGNSAIVYQSSPESCEVTVALNRGGGVLDIDLRGVVSPRVPLCQAAANLAARAFDRLPTG